MRRGSDGFWDEQVVVVGEGHADVEACRDEVARTAQGQGQGEDEGRPCRGGQAVAVMIVACPTCAMCGNRAVLHDVDHVGYMEWSKLGKNIQDALPELDADQRELLMSGTHAHCWQRMFGGDDAS